MKILVTGATGLLGSHLIRHLISKGHQIRATKRESSDVSLLNDVDKSIEWVDADMLDLQLLSRSFDSIDYVVHCAAKVSFDKKDASTMKQINIEGTTNVVNICLDRKIKKLIYVSSVATLGGENNKPIINESANWESSQLTSVYAETKHTAELQVWRAYEEGLNMAMVNPSAILGPANWSSASLQLFKYVLDERTFYPSGDINYVDVRDVVYVISSLLFNDISGERFILNAGKVSYKYFFTQLANQFNKKPPAIRATSLLITFAYIFESLISLITGRKAIITKDSIRMSKMTFLYSSDKVREALNMEFTPLEETITWACSMILQDLKK